MFVHHAPSNMKGSVAEMAIAKEAALCGAGVLFPLTEHGRYDMVFEVGEKLLRVQCKAATKQGEVVVVRLVTNRRCADGFKQTKYSREEIDLVAAYCEELDTCYLIPIGRVEGMCAIHLRLTPARNNQQAAVNYAREYEFRGAVAQLARAIGWQPVGRGFESHQLHLPDPEVETVGAEQFGYAYARFLERAAAGESFLVTRRGRPMARISPAEPPCGNPDPAALNAVEPRVNGGQQS